MTVDLEALRALERAATPGPMQVTADPYEDGTPYFRFRIGDGDYDDDTRHGAQFTSIMSSEDAGLIEALWNNRNKMISAARERDALQKALGAIETRIGTDFMPYSQCLADIRDIIDGAPNAFPSMADEIERLRADNAALREDIDLLRARAPRAYILTRKEEWLRLFREVYGYLKTCHRQHGTDLAGRDHAMKALIEAQLYLAPEDERAIKIAAYHIDLAVEKPAIDAALGEPR